MDQKIIRKPYSPEFRERAVRLFVEHRPEYPGDVAALRALAEKLGCSPDSLDVWARQARWRRRRALSRTNTRDGTGA